MRMMSAFQCQSLTEVLTGPSIGVEWVGTAIHLHSYRRSLNPHTSTKITPKKQSVMH